jgi:hypothetical protein
MSTRVITKQQFSAQTTIDGTRIEKSLENVKERYNDPEFRDVDMWVENKFHYGFTPQIRKVGIGGSIDNVLACPPFLNIPNSVMPDPEGLAAQSPNNPFRFKGAGISSATTGQPISTTSPALPIHLGLNWYWTTTQYYKQPVILQELVMHGLFDDKIGGVALAEQWFTNDWGMGRNIGLEDWVMWIVIDNPQNTTSTFLRNNEIHLWSCNSMGLMMNEIVGPTNSDTNENVPYNPTLTVAEQKINGLEAKITDINIPIPAGSRVRFVFALPSWEQAVHGPGFTADYTGTMSGEPYNNLNNAVDPADATNRRPTFANNIWCLNIAVLEPMERINE